MTSLGRAEEGFLKGMGFWLGLESCPGFEHPWMGMCRGPADAVTGVKLLAQQERAVGVAAHWWSKYGRWS